MESVLPKENLVIGVIGAGAMGRGIAQVAATGGMTVLLTDTRPEAVADAVKSIEKALARLTEKGTIDQAAMDRALGRIKPAQSVEQFAECRLVIEAIIERLDVKQALLAQLESIVSDDCIIASNTSSLSITTIASKCRHPGRVAGFHFFNPVPAMKLVEVIDGLQTRPDVGDALMDVGRRMGREPVRIKDAPGFLVNQVGRAYTLEAAHLVSEGIATFADVDAVMRETVGFRMGPFELLDLVGLDVNHPATDAIYRQFYHEPRYRPSVLMQSRLDAGMLGRKTKRGFYDYSEQKDAPLAAEAANTSPSSCPVWVSRFEPEQADKLLALLKTLNVKIEDGAKPSSAALCLVTPLGDDATHSAVEQGLDARRVVAVDTLFDLGKRRTIMSTPVTESSYINAARSLLGSDGVAVTATRDSPGFIAQRIVAMIANIGASIAQNRTASASDIDKAVKLGLGYPHGPLGFGDALGAGTLLKILNNMQRRYDDPRYRSNLWLTRRAELGVSLTLQD
ncbi:3-hydroxyacyl-CoA dehydrogenase [[Pseudomonas] carboxydohydrogena]|uniref:3-hydroxyacyl-CoA dehydrogenase n=1 Tax=Afipia carboxydohydrogena TaxID=290 RepID=A0ABY8BPP8_AFICR|nr:3-hydroxyacyl-CoA dehydrogenase [[Pseudomonas] carboxydohydrogena]WEF50946.1 3-hydroxyacyl-CoA dehydrogenase [[Pseudomonas] carboxydohydrogena]